MTDETPQPLEDREYIDLDSGVTVRRRDAHDDSFYMVKSPRTFADGIAIRRRDVATLARLAGFDVEPSGNGTVSVDARELEEGTVIGYHPGGDEDVRQVGVVKRHTGGNVNIGVVVGLEDDPRIEEFVRYEDIQAVEVDDG